MATDGTKIIDGDTAHDTYWGIMDLYDSEAESEMILNEFSLEQPDYFDDFANLNLTVIIEPNMTTRMMQEQEPGDGYVGGGGGSSSSTIYYGNENRLAIGGDMIREVKWGHGRLNRNYDSWVSFTCNGGGSEMQFCRKGSKEHLEVDSTGNISNSQWDITHAAYYSRKDVRKDRWKWLASNFDTNWEGNNSDIFEQTMCIWESDTEGNVQASGNLKWKDESLLNFDYDIGNRSKDQLLHHDQWDVNWFFQTALIGHGCGMKQGEGVFNRNWPIRECGTDFEYTMVHRWLDVGDNTPYYY